jgi:hypothetical protein
MSQRSRVARIGEYLLQQAALILAMLSVCMSLCAVEAVPSNEELERSHALIAKVVIDNENIFDLTDPRENNWLFRLANRVHIKTRPNVIRTQLLFKPGDPYSRRLLKRLH